MIIVDARGLIEATPAFINELIRQLFVVLHSSAVIFVGLSETLKEETRMQVKEFGSRVYFDIDWRDI